MRVPLNTVITRVTDLRGDSTRVVHPLFQEDDDGSIPISPLRLEFGTISVPLAIKLNELWHSRLPDVVRGNIDRNRHKVCYGALYKNLWYASAIWSSPVAGDALTKGEFWLELRRYAIANDSPKNTATRMLSYMVRDIRKQYPEITHLISYQDTSVHNGTIYKAANWTAEHEVTDTNWGLRRSEHGRKRNKVVAPGKKIRWGYDL